MKCHSTAECSGVILNKYILAWVKNKVWVNDGESWGKLVPESESPAVKI